METSHPIKPGVFWMSTQQYIVENTYYEQDYSGTTVLAPKVAPLGPFYHTLKVFEEGICGLPLITFRLPLAARYCSRTYGVAQQASLECVAQLCRTKIGTQTAPDCTKED